MNTFEAFVITAFVLALWIMWIRWMMRSPYQRRKK